MHLHSDIIRLMIFVCIRVDSKDFKKEIDTQIFQIFAFHFNLFKMFHSEGVVIK